MNALLPENNAQALAALVMRFAPVEMGGAVGDVIRYCKRTPLAENVLLDRHTPYVHGVFYLQVLQGLGFYSDYSHHYVYVPKDADPSKLQVFFHGYAGNFLYYVECFEQYYSGVYPVVFPTTRGVSGIFTETALQTFLQSSWMNDNYDEGMQGCRFVGLSNGGSGVSSAYKLSDGKAADYIYLSCSSRFNTAKIKVVGGTNDRSFGTMRRNRVRRFQGEDHSLLFAQTKEVVDVITKE
ncbi:hypothetical protein [Carboxylicivirga sp. N1Y90]|uniref:hypothetical protein n=1 Tax=Carboxylicivirga fragile TaxID=3417571 RepID=UPI003D325578|nr:hypothetical protein [Marinilabiliaceae bacterium N1Y90]